MTAAEILGALGHPNRLHIIECLADGPKCNCEIAPVLGLEQSNLSRHLSHLVRSGLLLAERQGNRVTFALADKQILRIVELAERVAKGGVKRMLRDHAA